MAEPIRWSVATMGTRPLVPARYQATDSFRAVTDHAAVAWADDGGVVAVTGPSDDETSQRYARLFAAAPEFLRAIRWAVGRADDALAFFGDGRPHSLDYALDVLEEVRAELAGALRAADQEAPR